MIFTESKRDAAVDSEEAFRQSLVEFTHQLAARKVPEAPEFPIASDDDSEEPIARRSWRRPAIMAALIVALLAGFYSFRDSPPSTQAAPPAPRKDAKVVAPPPPTTPAPPTTNDFAQPAQQAEARQVIAPPPAPAQDQPPAEFAAPLDRRGIEEVQTRLQSLGISPGPIDGVAGRLTQGAVRRYEQSKGQPATGTVDAGLLQRLRQESVR